MGKKRLQMQRRVQPARDVKPDDGVPDYEYAKYPNEDPNRNKVNQYSCWTCGGVITTVDRDYGTTPAMLNCQATKGCNGTMHSARYQVDQTLKPDYEWFRPARLPRNNPGMRQHL